MFALMLIFVLFCFDELHCSVLSAFVKFCHRTYNSDDSVTLKLDQCHRKRVSVMCEVHLWLWIMKHQNVYTV